MAHAHAHTVVGNRPPHSRGAVLVALVLVAGVRAGTCPPATADQEPAGFHEAEAVDGGVRSDTVDIRLDGDRLTANVVDMSIRNFLLEVGKLAGAEVRIDGLEERTVSASFSRLALEEALRRVLGGRNFTLTYDEHPAADGDTAPRLKALHVYGGSGAVVTSAPTAAQPARTPTAAGPSVGAAVAPRATPGARSARLRKRATASGDEAVAESAQPADAAVEGEAQPAAAAGAVPAAAIAEDEAQPDDAGALEPDAVAGPMLAQPVGDILEAHDASAGPDGAGWAPGPDAAVIDESAMDPTYGDDVEGEVEDDGFVP